MLGTKMGRLTAVEEATITHASSPRVWPAFVCECECGSRITVQKYDFLRGHTKSCGCMKSEKLRNANTAHGHAQRGSKTAEYTVWARMRQRCNDPNDPGYAAYGAKGIGYDPRWNDFAVFLADMGPRPEGASIDRINNDFGYSKDNCRWATRAEQSRNRKFCHRITYQGRTMTLAEWAREIGVSWAALRIRLRKGEPLDRALRPKWGK